jgi:hypothetical protein
MVALSAWGLVRMCRTPTVAWGAVFGLMAAAATLTRVSALTFVAPVLAAFVILGDRHAWRPRARSAAMAVAVFAVFAGPYFVAITRETGDPFFAVNYHTIYYLDHEGEDPTQGVTAAQYVRRKFQAAPLATTETAVRGLTDVPFDNKWNGFKPWVPGLGGVLQALAIGGLLGWLFVPAGRLLLLMLAGVLAPYMVTWPVGDGAAWRFTMPAYPFYLVAAVWFAGEAVRLADLARHAAWRADLPARALPRLAIALGVAAVFLAFTHWIPYLVARESLGRGDATTIAVSGRDGVFFADGWTGLAREGNVTARMAAGERATLVLPLPGRRAYHVMLRMDPLPFAGAPPQRVRASVDGHPLAEWTLVYSPERVGAYALDIPADFARAGRTRLELTADYVRPMAAAGDAFPEIPRDQPAAFRFWYVRITPR